VPETWPVLKHECGVSECDRRESECEHREECEHEEECERGESECGVLASKYKCKRICIGQARERVQVASASISVASMCAQVQNIS